MQIAADTIEQAEKRLLLNNAELEVVNADIAHQEELRDIAQMDQDQAQSDLDEETARWDGVVASYEDLIATLQNELSAIDQVIELFSSAEISGDMLSRMDMWYWWSMIYPYDIYEHHHNFEKIKFLKNQIFQKMLNLKHF